MLSPPSLKVQVLQPSIPDLYVQRKMLLSMWGGGARGVDATFWGLSLNKSACQAHTVVQVSREFPHFFGGASCKEEHALHLRVAQGNRLCFFFCSRGETMKRLCWLAPDASAALGCSMWTSWSRNGGGSRWVATALDRPSVCSAVERWAWATSSRC